MILIKVRLGFLVTDLSQHFAIYLLVVAVKFFIHGYVGDLSHLFLMYSRYGNSISNHTQKIDFAKHFRNVFEKRLLRGIHETKKEIGIAKCYLV